MVTAYVLLRFSFSPPLCRSSRVSLFQLYPEVEPREFQEETGQRPDVERTRSGTVESCRMGKGSGYHGITSFSCALRNILRVKKQMI